MQSHTNKETIIEPRKQESQMMQRYYQELKNDTDPRNKSVNMMKNPSQISPKSIKSLSEIWKN